MKVTKISLLAAVAALTLTTACKQTPADNTVEFGFYTASASYKAKAEYIEGEVSKFIVTDSVNIILPIRLTGNISVEELRDSIFSYTLDTINVANPQEALNAYVNDSTRWEEFMDARISRAHEVTDIYEADGFTLTQGNIERLTEDLLVYRVNKSLYVPMAAHGMEYVYYVNFYQKDGGKILKLSDLLKRSAKDKILKLIRKQAIEDYGKESVMIDDYPSGDNFYISSSNEIVFVYQTYEVACYAVGLVSVNVSAYQLTDYLTPFGREIFNISD